MFITLLTHLLIGFLLSFIGSIPFGMINITVADTAIKRGFTAGLWVGLGAAAVEFFQSFLAIQFTYLFLQNTALDFYFNIIALCIFIGLAIYYLLLQKPGQANKIKANEKKMNPFWKGVIVSLMNVLVFPYWIFYGAYLNTHGLLRLETIFVLTLCFGIFLGAMTTFVFFAKMGTWAINRGPHLMKFVNIFIGIIFLIFSFFQIWKIWKV